MDHEESKNYNEKTMVSVAEKEMSVPPSPPEMLAHDSLEGRAQSWHSELPLLDTVVLNASGDGEPGFRLGGEPGGEPGLRLGGEPGLRASGQDSDSEENRGVDGWTLVDGSRVPNELDLGSWGAPGDEDNVNDANNKEANRTPPVGALQSGAEDTDYRQDIFGRGDEDDDDEKDAVSAGHR